MNILTRKIRNKGYSLLEFCEACGISLRSYRRYEDVEHDMHDKLVKLIDALPTRLNGCKWKLNSIKLPEDK